MYVVSDTGYKKRRKASHNGGILQVFVLARVVVL